MQFLNGQPENQAWTALDILSYILTRQTNRDSLPSFTKINIPPEGLIYIDCKSGSCSRKYKFGSGP